MRSVLLERESRLNETISRISRNSEVKKRTVSKERVLRTHSVIQNRLEELEIDDKLEDFNKKIHRSTENCARYLKHKVESIKNIRHRRNTMTCNDYSDKISKIAKKLENASTRRNQMKKEFYDKINQKEAKINERVQRVKNLVERETKNTFNKEKNKTLDFFSEFKQKQKNELLLKREKHKLFEEGIIDNLNRKKKVENMKKERIIEKHIELHQREKQHYQFLESVNRKIREKAMSFTIEREKVLELKAKISKSPRPDLIKNIASTIKRIRNS